MVPATLADGQQGQINCERDIMEPQYSLESIMDEVSQPSAEQDSREYRPDGMGQVLAGMVPVMESNTGWTAIKHQGAE
tara:strand:+ start:182 stop:415 length:234 start_codon:yes stop_codon:yes gene_type:complete